MLGTQTQTPPTRFRAAGLEVLAFRRYYFDAGAVVPVAFFVTLDLAVLCFFVFTGAGLVSVVPAAGGLAGAVCAANIEAVANAIVIRVFFISFFSLAGLPPALYFHLAACAPKTR